MILIFTRAESCISLSVIITLKGYLQGTTEIVESVSFRFFTDDEVRKHSVMKITNPVLLDGVQRPVPGGLYDPSLGPLDDTAP